MNDERAYAENSGHLNKTIGLGLLIAVVFAALAHGAVEPWSVFVFEALVVALVLLWSIKVAADKRLKLTVPDIALPIAALVAVGLLQSIAFTDSSGRWISLSRNVEYTRAAVTVLAFLLISFLIASNFFASRGRLRALSHFLVIYGLGMAMFALIQHFTWNGRFYWIRPTQATSPFGPFANHNHFAGYMELLIPIPLAFVVTRAVRAELRVLYGFAAAMMGIAAVLSLSRGGIISIAAGVVFLTFMSVKLTRRRRDEGTRGRPPQLVSRFAAVIGIVAIITAGIFWIGADPVINRVTQGQASAPASPKETFYSSRGWVWRDTMTMIRANPMLGVGLGAYETAFSIYTQSDGSLRVPQAHNDFLQVVADCGIVGGVIAVWFLVLLFRAVARGARSSDPLYAALAVGCGAGIFGMLVHSLFDFNLQLPSNALLFLLLSAVASHVGTAVRDREGSASQSLGRRSNQLETQSVSSARVARGAL
ncbi:MAG TPA: O-antigen ligase family protein [Blastocatellia bacterium]|nr:O-antigen ligase family protein [Blastocatellia bacterium]